MSVNVMEERIKAHMCWGSYNKICAGEMLQWLRCALNMCDRKDGWSKTGKMLPPAIYGIILYFLLCLKMSIIKLWGSQWLYYDINTSIFGSRYNANIN